MKIRKPRNTGFTLIELMIVIAIIGIIGGLVVTNIMAKYRQAQYDGTKTKMKGLGAVLDQFSLDCSFYPTTDQGLDALAAKPTAPGPNGKECKNYNPNGYVKNNKIPTDEWNNPFIYESDGQSWELKSLGQDGKEGGTDYNADISSKDL